MCIKLIEYIFFIIIIVKNTYDCYNELFIVSESIPVILKIYILLTKCCIKGQNNVCCKTIGLFYIMTFTFYMRDIILVHPNFVSQFSQPIMHNFHTEIAYNTIRSLNDVLYQVGLTKFLWLLIKFTYNFYIYNFFLFCH